MILFRYNFSSQKNHNRTHMLFQCLCGIQPIFYSTHPNEEPKYLLNKQTLINSNTVMGTMLTMIFLLFSVTGMVGTVMFSLSVCLNRTAAVLVGTVLAVFTVVLENMYRYCEWLVFFSPFSWTNLLLLYQRTRKMAPSVHMAILMIIIVGTVFTILALKRMLIIDLHWSDEE